MCHGLIYTLNDWNMCDEFRKSTMTEFDMTNFDRMRYFLDFKVIQNL